MKLVITIMLLAALTTGARAQGKEFLELLYPPEYTSITKNSVSIVGRTSAPILEIYLNGKKISEAIIYDSVFHERISFGVGLNEITVIPVVSGDREPPKPVTLEIMYGQNIERKYRKIFPPYQFHNSQSKELCVKCHACDCEEIGDTTDAKVCLECHQNLIPVFKQHNKSDSATCVICHNMNSDLVGQFAGDDVESNPCFACHTDRKGLFSQEYIHGPVAGGSCTICHNPHGSRYDKSLVAPQQILCVSCHEDIEDQMQKDVVHKPFQDGQCGTCHDPHATSNKWVLLKNTEELCMGCHDPEGSLKLHKHPYNVRPKKSLKVDLELTERGNLECVSCHNPHSTRAKHLLRINQEFTCIGCHADIL